MLEVQVIQPVVPNFGKSGKRFPEHRSCGLTLIYSKRPSIINNNRKIHFNSTRIPGLLIPSYLLANLVISSAMYLIIKHSII